MSGRESFPIRNVTGASFWRFKGAGFSVLAFAKPSEGVRFALQAQARLRQFSRESGLPIQERMGIHLGEVVIAENETEAKAKDLYGIQLTTGARVMSLAEGGQICLQVWDIEQRRCIQSEKTHAYYISDIATCLDGTVFATGGDQTVVLWDALARKQVTRWRGHLGVVLAVDFAPDGKTISSTGIDGTRLWSAGNTATRHRLLGSSRAVGFLPDGKTLVAEVEDGLMIWDLASNTTANIRSPGLGFSISPYKPAANLAVSPREPVVALGKTSGIIEVREVPSREIKRTWPAHTNAIRVIIFSPDGTQLATASATGEIRVWNIARQESVTQLAPRLRSITCLAFSPDGRQLLVCGESDTIWRYDLAHGRELSPLRTSEGWAVDAAFSPDGALLASSALQASAIDLRDMPSGNLRAVLRGAVQVPLRVAFSPDGRTLAAGLDTKGVTLWHLATGQELLHLPCDGFFETLCYSPDGRILAVGSYKGTQREIRLHHAPPLSEMDSARQGQRNPSSPPL